MGRKFGIPGYDAGKFFTASGFGALLLIVHALVVPSGSAGMDALLGYALTLVGMAMGFVEVEKDERTLLLVIFMFLSGASLVAVLAMPGLQAVVKIFMTGLLKLVGPSAAVVALVGLVDIFRPK